MDTPNPDEFFRLPNDNAYTKAETREGPPLSYVAEKFRRNLEALRFHQCGVRLSLAPTAFTLLAGG